MKSRFEPNLEQAASVKLTDAPSVAELAQREGCEADSYTLALVKRIGVSDLTFNQQVSRLQALAGIATNTSPEAATAEELARHYVLTYALFERFSLLAGDCAATGKTRAAGVYMAAAASAQRANLAVLNALETLRQQAKQPSAAPLTG
jgi:hypothetical protein